MKITSIESQKKNVKRFNVFLDGKFALGADEDLVVDFRLVQGKEMNEQDLEKLIFEAEVGKLMERMYGFFNIRQRSEKEVRDYLKLLSFKRKVKGQEELSEIVIENIVNKLKRKGLLNDEAFAKAWIEARRKSKKKGKIALKQELFQKGISKHLIDESLESGESEEKLAEQAIEKKVRLWKNSPQMEFRKKASEFLMRRGFEYDVVKTVVEKTMKKEYNNIEVSEDLEDFNDGF